MSILSVSAQLLNAPTMCDSDCVMQYYEHSPLDLASVELESLPCLSALLDLGADVNARDSYGESGSSMNKLHNSPPRNAEFRLDDHLFYHSIHRLCVKVLKALSDSCFFDNGRLSMHYPLHML